MIFPFPKVGHVSSFPGGYTSHPKNWSLEEDPFPLSLSLSLSVRHWRTGRLGVDPVCFVSLRGYVNKLQGLVSFEYFHDVLSVTNPIAFMYDISTY